MCPYENSVGCFKCPFPDCMLNGADKLPRSLQKEFRKSHHGNREKEREYNARYRAEHKEEIAAKEKERRRKMKAALEYCERMGIEV